MKKLFPLIMILALLFSAPAWAQTAEEPTRGFPPQNPGAELTREPAGNQVSDLQPLVEPRAPVAPEPGFDLPVSGVAIAGIIGALLLLLASLYLALKALGHAGSLKKNNKHGQKGFVIKAAQALDNKKYLTAVEFEGRTIVMGITSDRIIPIAQWLNDEYENEPDLPLSNPSRQSQGFEIKLPDDDFPTFDLGLNDLSPTPKNAGRPNHLQKATGSSASEISRNKSKT